MSSNNPENSSKHRNVDVDLHDPRVHASLDRYWRRNVRITVFLLLIWAIAGLGAGILWADKLNGIRLLGSGFPLGFWFAQQGSILIFVLLILVYCLWMNHLDAEHHRDLERIREDRK